MRVKLNARPLIPAQADLQKRRLKHLLGLCASALCKTSASCDNVLRALKAIFSSFEKYRSRYENSAAGEFFFFLLVFCFFFYLLRCRWIYELVAPCTSRLSLQQTCGVMILPCCDVMILPCCDGNRAFVLMCGGGVAITGSDRELRSVSNENIRTFFSWKRAANWNVRTPHPLADNHEVFLPNVKWE